MAVERATSTVLINTKKLCTLQIYTFMQSQPDRLSLLSSSAKRLKANICAAASVACGKQKKLDIAPRPYPRHYRRQSTLSNVRVKIRSYGMRTGKRLFLLNVLTKDIFISLRSMVAPAGATM